MVAKTKARRKPNLWKFGVSKENLLPPFSLFLNYIAVLPIKTMEVQIDRSRRTDSAAALGCIVVVGGEQPPRHRHRAVRRNT